MAEHLTATAAFLFLEGVNGGAIQGEAQDSVHANEIQLMSFGFKVSGDSREVGEGSWRAEFGAVELSIVTSRASPSLFRAACGGTVFKRATISCRKQGASRATGDYLQWRFSNVQVSNYNFGVEDDKPTERVELTYQGVEVYYARQDSDGSLKDAIKRSWSIVDNKDGTPTLPYTPK